MCGAVHFGNFFVWSCPFRKLFCVELSISQTFVLKSDISQTFLWNYSFSLFFFFPYALLESYCLQSRNKEVDFIFSIRKGFAYFVFFFSFWCLITTWQRMPYSFLLFNIPHLISHAWSRLNSPREVDNGFQLLRLLLTIFSERFSS